MIKWPRHQTTVLETSVILYAEAFGQRRARRRALSAKGMLQGAARPARGALLERAVLFGEVPCGEVSSLVGGGERQGRWLPAPLVQRRFLTRRRMLRRE
jgi:hypothetical protein